jgi:hypothetical protein
MVGFYVRGDRKMSRGMRFNAPTAITWVIGLILGVLGLLGHFGTVAALSSYAFWLVVAGLAVMLVAPLLGRR